MSLPREDSMYMVVAAEEIETSDFLVPSGKTVEIREFQGSAAYLDDTTAALIWDPAGANTILVSTHGDATAKLCTQVVGDGVKVIRIELTNDTLVARVLGAQWEGGELH